MRIKYIFCLLAILAVSPLLAQQVEWKTEVSSNGDESYRVTFTAVIPEGWHMYDLGLYDDMGPIPTSFDLSESQNLNFENELSSSQDSHRIYDQWFSMEIGYYEGTAVFTRDFILSSEGAAVLKGSIEWMICNDTTCLPPDDHEFEIVIREGSYEAGFTGPVEDNYTFWGLVLAAMGWALFALFTPCVFPMIPMTVSYFIKNSGTPAQGRFRASMYGIFIVALYTLPIAIIVLTTALIGGKQLSSDIFNWLSTHWLPNVIFFLVFIIFAASFFGAFEITLPSWMVNKSDRQSDKGGLKGVFFMALTLVLVSFSCTGPLIGNALINSTSGAKLWEPIITMFAFSLTFAIPFTLFAFFPSFLEKMPKSGGWLNSVKVVLGFIEVALGLKFLSVADQTYNWGLLDREIYLAIWIVVFTLMGFYLLGKIRFAHDSEVKHIGVGRLLLVIATFTFVVYLIPGMFGAPLKGLSGYLPPMHTQDFVLNSSGIQINEERNNFDGKAPKHSDFLHLPHGLSGFFDLEEAREYAERVGKPLFVDITGAACVNCREMEARVWSDPEVLDILRNEYVVVAVYVDIRKQMPQSEWITNDNGKVLKTLGRINAYKVLKLYGVNAQPYYILEGKNGEMLAPARGYNLSVPGFVEFLRSGVERYNN